MLLSAQSYSGFGLQKIINLPNVGDSILKQQVDYIDPGTFGTNILWNFQNVKPINDYYSLYYAESMADSSVFGGTEHGTVYYYKVHGDSLFHTGYENSTTLMRFKEPELRLKFPFRYKETIESYFIGEGEYCNRIPLHVSGKTVAEADATGTLITPLGLKFENVLRIKTLREYEETGKDSLTMHLESYAWYVKNNRYPVFETIKTSTKKTGKHDVEHKVASFFYPPADQAGLLADTSNWNREYQTEESLSIDQIFSNCRLMPNPVHSQLKIEYDLINDATVSFRLCDSRGVVKIVTSPLIKQAGYYTETFNMDGFIAGVYLLYVNADNFIKIMKVIKN